MRKKKRQVTLNIRLLGIQLLTLLPVFLLLIFVSYSMLRNLSGQIYDIRENEIDITKAEATLRIGIEFTHLGVTIKIPDWEIVDVKPEF